jgi:hypothetical protein
MDEAVEVEAHACLGLRHRKLWLRNGLSRAKRSISDYCTIVYSRQYSTLPVSYLPWSSYILNNPKPLSRLPLYPLLPWSQRP